MTTNGYLIKEGFDNLRKHSSKTRSTILIICATMFVVGIFLLILQNVNYNVNVIKEEQGSVADQEVIRHCSNYTQCCERRNAAEHSSVFFWLNMLSSVTRAPASLATEFVSALSQREQKKEKYMTKKIQHSCGCHWCTHNELSVLTTITIVVRLVQYESATALVLCVMV